MTVGQIGEQTLQLPDLRLVVVNDEGVRWMPRPEVLMIGFRWIQGAADFDRGYHKRVERVRLIELRDIRLGNISLLLSGRKDR
jgi:hypothetical protein